MPSTHATRSDPSNDARVAKASRARCATASFAAHGPRQLRRTMRAADAGDRSLRTQHSSLHVPSPSDCFFPSPTLDYTIPVFSLQSMDTDSFLLFTACVVIRAPHSRLASMSSWACPFP